MRGVLAAIPIAFWLASCATTRPALPDYNDILVDAYVRGSDRYLEGVACTLVNDKGRWAVVATGVARVERSSQPLEFECTKEGYAPSRGKPRCFTERQYRQVDEAFGALQLFAAVPAVIVAAPIAPALAAKAATQGAQGAASVAGSELPKEDIDRCVYRRISVPMTPLRAEEIDPRRR